MTHRVAAHHVAKKAAQANGHDMGLKDKVAPFGILDVMTGLPTIFFGISCETNDFIADCLEQGWNNNKEQYRHIRQLVINRDNGPQNSSHRTSFMKRMIDFADKNNLEIVLAYYPPYFSKYNPIERCWGILENHWRAALLNTIETPPWNGQKPWHGKELVRSLNW